MYLLNFEPTESNMELAPDNGERLRITLEHENEHYHKPVTSLPVSEP